MEQINNLSYREFKRTINDLNGVAKRLTRNQSILLRDDIYICTNQIIEKYNIFKTQCLSSLSKSSKAKKIQDIERYDKKFDRIFQLEKLEFIQKKFGEKFYTESRDEVMITEKQLDFIHDLSVKINGIKRRKTRKEEILKITTMCNNVINEYSELYKAAYRVLVMCEKHISKEHYDELEQRIDLFIDCPHAYHQLSNRLNKL